MNNAKEFLLNEGLTVLLRGFSPEESIPLVKAAFDGGVRVFEITYNPSDPDTVKKTTYVMKTIINEYGDSILVGSGTTLFPEYVKATKEAGGEFIISPNTDPEIISLTKSLGMISIPGAYTPTECMQAIRSGADFVKLFPITENDLGYLKNITSPLSNMKFICTGGVNPDTIDLFLNYGATGLGTGASIFKKDLVEKKDYKAITEIARIHVDKVKESMRKYQK